MTGDDFIVYGGVKLNKSEVRQKFTTEDVNGNKHYVVDFKNGARVAYQGGLNPNASIDACSLDEPDFDGNKFNRTAIFNVMGLEIQGTKGHDTISVNDSSIIGIDVSGDNVEDAVLIRNSKGKFDARGLGYQDHNFGDGLVEADSGDTVEIDAQSTLPSVKRK